MLEHSKAFSSFSVSNIEKAKEFYGSTLGLSIKDNEMGILELQIGGSAPVMIYPKENHQAATFTVLNFPVQSVEFTIDALIVKGVQFEHYDSEYLKTDDKGIFRGDGHMIAWFKDPDGNILSVLETNKQMG
ncbi:VOC family protein [Pedobacter sp. ASV1-7]|uniref:VOC family protein n=1 Tax=Pedobacter sp. ASV1-7 TaxID=3145237 RepID=UPI0032E91D5D